MNSISIGDIMISGSILLSAVGATWRIGNRFSTIERKLDSHIASHEAIQEYKYRKDVRRGESYT